MANPAPSRSGFAAGAVAALLAAVVMLALGALAGVPVPLQLIADRLTILIPLDLFGTLLGSLEAQAKPLALAGAIIAQVLLAGAVAPVSLMRCPG